MHAKDSEDSVVQIFSEKNISVEIYKAPKGLMIKGEMAGPRVC